MNLTMDFLNSPVFICGAGRSGTTLLSNLLDGHSELLVLPNETHILQYFKAYNGEARRTFFLRDYLFTGDILEYTSPAYREERNRYTTAVYGAGAAWDLSSVNGEAFIETYTKFLQENEISLEVLYKAIAISLFNSCPSLGMSKSPKSFVEKRPLDNEISAIVLKEHFPKARFVHILRDPRTRYASAKKRRIGSIRGFKFCPRLNGKDFVRGHAEISMLSFALAKRNQALLGDDYLVIKYEDLTSQPSEVMKIVSDFLSLPWEDILLTQTCLGKKTGSASSFKTALDRVTATDVDRMKAYNSLTTRLERRIVNLYNQEVAQEFGYALGEVKPIPTLNLFCPVKYELPFHYFGNRLSYLKQIWGRTSTQVVDEAINQILSKWESGIPTQD
ncbi:MAG: sulfotransferase [Candidatus Omnitrophica bacterium]|nr:sulfotransferase [Candidatus Omnitrophota bacterium]